MAVLFAPLTVVATYFLLSDRDFLVRRLQYREKEAVQKGIIKYASLLTLIGILITGLDRRFGWSHMPAQISLIADAIVFFSYLAVFYVFYVNRYAARTITVEKGQKLITTGPYAIVRHPMYVAEIIMYLAIPIALGSYYAFIPFLPIPFIMVLRIFNEEEVLMRDLKGYKKYMQKTRFRLIPFVW